MVWQASSGGIKGTRNRRGRGGGSDRGGGQMQPRSLVQLVQTATIWRSVPLLLAAFTTRWRTERVVSHLTADHCEFEVQDESNEKINRPCKDVQSFVRV